MTIKVNAMGDACPVPVVKTQKAMQELGGAGTVETLVDNETAVQNLGKLAASKGCTSKTEKLGENEYRVTITVGENAKVDWHGVMPGLFIGADALEDPIRQACKEN